MKLMTAFYLLHLKIVFKFTNATIWFFHLALLFLSVVVRRCDDILLDPIQENIILRNHCNLYRVTIKSQIS